MMRGEQRWCLVKYGETRESWLSDESAPGIFCAFGGRGQKWMDVQWFGKSENAKSRWMMQMRCWKDQNTAPELLETFTRQRMSWSLYAEVLTGRHEEKSAECW